METQHIFDALSNFGAFGILVGYLIWDRKTTEGERRLQQERRMQYDKDRLETDRDLAASLAALTSAVNSNRGR